MDDEIKLSGAVVDIITTPTYIVAVGPCSKVAVIRRDGKEDSDGTVVRNLRGHEGAVWSIAPTPDKKQIVTGSINIILWNLDPREKPLVRRYKGAHKGIVSAVRVTPCGTKIVSGCSEGRVIVWNLHTGDVLRVLAKIGLGVESLCISPNGRFLYVAKRRIHSKACVGMECVDVERIDMRKRKFKKIMYETIRPLIFRRRYPVATSRSICEPKNDGSVSATFEVTRKWFCELVHKSIEFDRKTNDGEEKPSFKMDIERLRGMELTSFCVSANYIAIAFKVGFSFGDERHSIVIFNRKTFERQRVIRLERARSVVLSLCFTDDEKHLITGSEDGLLTIVPVSRILSLYYVLSTLCRRCCCVARRVFPTRAS